jgi:hypothetical protein
VELAIVLLLAVTIGTVVLL